MSDDKTEEPSAQKLRKAREEGNVPKSQEFTGMLVMVTALVATLAWWPSAAGRILGFFREATEFAARTPDHNDLLNFLKDSVEVMAFAITPILAASFAIALFVNYVQVGPVFAKKPLIPDMTRLNPAGGLKNMFTKQKLIELGKNLLKLAMMGWVGTWLYTKYVGQLALSPRLELIQAIATFYEIAYQHAKYLVGGLVIFAIIDLLLVRRKYRQDMMMSKQEVKDEYKQSEGDQNVKGQRKRLHQEMLREAGTSRVKTADAVVVNPTHLAVAILYDEDTMRAPEVIASGRGGKADEIRRLAKRHGVPIVRNVNLARALINVDVEDEIPGDLYEAVAEVLMFVYDLRKKDAAEKR